MIDPRDPMLQRLFNWMTSRQAKSGGLLGIDQPPESSATVQGLLGADAHRTVIQAADVPSQAWYKQGLGYVPERRATPQQLSEMTDAELLAWWRQLNKKKGEE